MMVLINPPQSPPPPLLLPSPLPFMVAGTNAKSSHLHLQTKNECSFGVVSLKS